MMPCIGSACASSPWPRSSATCEPPVGCSASTTHFLPVRSQMLRHGSTEMLRPRERRAPRMPNATPVLVEGRCWPTPSPIPATARTGSRPSWPGRGVASASRSTAAGGCCAATASTPGPPAWPRWPATPQRPSGNSPSLLPSATSTSNAWSAGAVGLLLRREAVGDQGHRLAVHRHRRGLGLHLGRAARLHPQPPGPADLRPGPARGPGPGGEGVVPRGGPVEGRHAAGRADAEGVSSCAKPLRHATSRLPRPTHDQNRLGSCTALRSQDASCRSDSVPAILGASGSVRL